MRVVHFSETDLGGGAGIACYRLHRALLAAGVDSRLMVSRKFSADPTVQEAFPPRLSTVRRLLRERLDRLPLVFYPQRQRTDFSPAWLNGGAWRAAGRERADLVHLHWTNLGFLGVREWARFRGPVVYTLHDMWPFTGGCHYAGDCRKFLEGCGACPILASHRQRDLTHRQFLRKQQLYGRRPFDYTCHSQQYLEFAQTSRLLRDQRGHLLPIGVDLDRFQPLERPVARRILGLPERGFLALFSALQLDQPRKGGDLLAAAATTLAAQTGAEALDFVTLGGGLAPERIGPFRVRHLGLLRDEQTVALALSAADVALIPSREDNGLNLTIEALACGTPVVGFPVGSNRDLVRTGENGFLARPFSAESLAEGLAWALAQQGNEAVRQAARASVRANHDVARQAARHAELYQQILASSAVR
jgi:glycosyltransferase involved in cell wall biosynthesis